MRLVIQGKELEFRVQERRVTTCSVFHKGKEIAADLAIHAPSDTYDQREGEKIAVTRVANILVERYQKDRQDAVRKVDQVFTEVGALSGNVELPQIPGANEIVGQVMEKLDTRRIKKSMELSVENRETMNTFHKIPLHPFLQPGTIFTGPRPRFDLGFGISTKPTGR